MCSSEKKKKVIIVGGGLSGLSASCYLAENNYDVTIIDKNESVVGRWCVSGNEGKLGLAD